MSSSHILVGFLLSALLNAYLAGRLIRERRRSAHKHTWTPWTDWRELHKYANAKYWAWFQRRRYCADCAAEERQNIGEHTCEELSNWKGVCSHREMYTGVFDPMYEIRQINKDLEELQ